MKEVKLIAVSPKYKKNPLILMAPVYGNTYITGQEYLPGDDKTNGGLTSNQMLGIDPLRDDQKKQYPYVLRPDVTYRFTNNQTFSMENPEHEAKLKFLLRVCPDVAPSKGEFVRGKHTHYIFDKIVEAKNNVSRMDIKYNAMAKVKAASFETVADVASYLSYVDIDFFVNVNASTKDEVYQAVYTACEKNPEKVIECFTQDIREEILIVKMIQMEVIKKTKDGFEDNGTWLGKTVADVIDYSRKKDNAGRVSRWEAMANKTTPIRPADESKIEDYLISFESSIKDEDFDEAISLNKVLDKKQLSESQNIRFMELKGQLAELQEDRANEAEVKLEEAKKVAEKEYEAMDLEALYKLCGEKRIKGTEWKEKEKKEVVELLVSKVKL